MQVTLKHIAKRLGVDPSTVSLALRGHAARDRGIPERRVKQIQRVAAEMGYRPNLSARNLKRGSTQCVGVVMSYLDHYPLNHYFNLLADGLRRQGFQAVPLPMERRLDRNREQLHLLESSHVDGLILLDYHRIAHEQYLKLQAQDYPLVFRLHDRADATFPFANVSLDRVPGIRALTHHILANGWTNLFILVEFDPQRPLMAGEDEHFLGRRMAQGLREGLAEFGLPPELEGRVICSRSRGARDRYEAVKRFLHERPLAPGTCVVQDGGDGISGTYAAIAEAGLRIGKDIAVAAQHDPPANEYVVPEPALLAEPFEQVAADLASILMMGLKGGGRVPPSASRSAALRVVPGPGAPPRPA